MTGNTDSPIEGDYIQDPLLQGKLYISYQDKDEIDSILKGQIQATISRGEDDVSHDNRIVKSILWKERCDPRQRLGA